MSFFSLFSFLSMMMGFVVLTVLPTTANELKPTPVEEVETLSPATGTLNDLNELPSKNVSDWSWSNGSLGEINTPEGFQLYQIDSQSYQANPSVDFLEEQNDWKKDNQGDVQAPSATIPLTKF